MYIKNLLLVRDPWATLILSGYKTWEIRGTRVHKDKFKTVAIAKSGEKGVHRIYGVVDIVSCHGPLTLKELQDSYQKHRDVEDTKKLPYPKTYAWELKNPRFLKTPIDYEYKNGWVIWGVGEWRFSESDFVNDSSLQVMESPSTNAKHRFLTSFSEDLSFFGYQLSFASLDDSDVYTVIGNDLESMDESDSHNHLHDAFVKLQSKNREHKKEKLNNIKKKLEKDRLIASKAVKVEELNIVLELVESKTQKDIHWYYRMHQNIPSSTSKGRVIDVIAYHIDPSNQTKHVVGVVGLGSPAYNSGVRDNLFGWPKSNNKDANKKNQGLRSILQINCIMAAPPYDRQNYRLTKLLATVVFSTEIVEAFQKKYQSPLLVAISSAGFGLSAPMFHRISLQSILKRCRIESEIALDSRDQNEAHQFWKTPSFKKGSRKNSKHWIFQKEAVTETRLFSLASDETRQLARSYCESSGAIKKMTSPNNAFKKALDLSGINVSVLPVAKRGIYVGLLDNTYIKSLVDGDGIPDKAKSIPWSELFFWWKVIELNRPRESQDIGN